MAKATGAAVVLLTRFQRGGHDMDAPQRQHTIDELAETVVGHRFDSAGHWAAALSDVADMTDDELDELFKRCS